MTFTLLMITTIFFKQDVDMRFSEKYLFKVTDRFVNTKLVFL